MPNISLGETVSFFMQYDQVFIYMIRLLFGKDNYLKFIVTYYHFVTLEPTSDHFNFILNV